MMHDSAGERWSLNGQIMAAVIAVEVVVAVFAIVHRDLHRPSVLVAATAVAIASAGFAARARMPAQAKALAISAVCAALLALAAAQDPFGLRAVDHGIRDAAQETYDPAAAMAATTPETPRASSQVSLRSQGDASAAAFADDLARSVALKQGDADGPYRIAGVVDVSSGALGDTYRLTWSLSRRAETAWCGRIVATGQARAAVLDSFSTTIAAALRQDPDGIMTCA